MNQENEKIKVSFMKGIQAKAVEFARKEMSVITEAHHMMAAIVESMAESYLFNRKVSAELNNIKADIASIRKAMGMNTAAAGADTDTDTDADTKSKSGLSLVH